MMKKNIFYSLTLLLAISLIFASCDKEDDFDYSTYVPVLHGLLGSSEIVSIPTLTYTFQTDGLRGGSTYTWSVTQGGEFVSVAPSPENSNFGIVTIDASTPTTTTVILSVVETTSFGVTSEAVTKSITLSPYVAVDLDAFTGNYIEADGDGQTAPVVISRDPADAYFGLIITGVLSEGYWWGPPGGTLKIKLFGVDESVFFAKQLTGIVDPTYGAVSLELLDGVKGSFDLDTKVISFTGKVTVAAGSFGSYPFSYTPAP